MLGRDITMSEQRLNEILAVCKRYSDSIDYYSLFALNSNSSLEEINSTLKKVRILFHPDQTSYVPEEYRETFDKILNQIPDIINTFSSISNRNKYDANLNKRKNESKEKDENDKILDAELQGAILSQVSNYGWKYTVNCLRHVVYNENFNVITRFGDARDTLRSIGANKIRELILNSSLGDIDRRSSITFEDSVVNYITDMFETNPDLASDLEIIKNACLETNKKHGALQAKSAMKVYFVFGDAHGFTNTNNARHDFVDNIEKPLVYRANKNNKGNDVDRSDVEFMMQVALNSKRFDNYAYSYANTKELSLDQLISVYNDQIEYNYGQSDTNYSR